MSKISNENKWYDHTVKFQAVSTPNLFKLATIDCECEHTIKDAITIVHVSAFVCVSIGIWNGQHRPQIENDRTFFLRFQ